MKAYIKTPPKQRYRYVPDLCRPFEAYIGRRLRKWEHAIIYAFEKNRKKGKQAGRFIIHDNDPNIDSRSLLITYFLWRAPFDDIMFVGPTRPQIANQVKEGLAQQDALKKNVRTSLCDVANAKTLITSGICPYSQRIIRQQTGTGQAPEGMRGRTWRHCLMINTERYKAYMDTIDTVVGPLPIEGDSIMVIHTKYHLLCPPAFTPTGPPIQVGIIDETGAPQIIIIELQQQENQANKCRDARSELSFTHKYALYIEKTQQ